MNTALNESSRICRICSSPADYDIFAKIPSYLHATTNEFLHTNWQQPINILLEQVTGLKVTKEDALPCTICAICISYLKHAVTFREQAITNTMALKAVQLLSTKYPTISNNIEEDKTSELITARDLLWAGDERQVDTKERLNTLLQDQNKVSKRLLNNYQSTFRPSAHNIEEHMRYLNLLFDKDANTGLTPKKRNCINAGSGEDGEEPTTTSSDENEDIDENGSLQQHRNIFSYQEKNFEEDDIMDLDELRNAIEINRPETCKERKCRACSRRFMFNLSYKDHMNSCIEYMFLTFIEEVNRLYEIRKNKAISPHEFIRRMIFSLRKTCEWLRANCDDTLLPDLSNAAIQQKKQSESEDKATSSDELKQVLYTQTKHRPELLATNKRRNQLIDDYEIKAKTNNSTINWAGSDFIPIDYKKHQKNNSINPKKSLLTDENDNIGSLFVTPKSKLHSFQSHNILYEIERTQSQNSMQQSSNDLHNILPLTHLNGPLLETNLITTTTTTTTATINAGNTPSVSNDKRQATLPDEERLTFMQKLQKAASERTPVNPKTSFKQVRKELLSVSDPRAANTDRTPLSMAPTALTVNAISAARCNPCDLVFENLAALEMHNAMSHNNSLTSKITNNLILDAERKKIISLFEDEDI